MFMVTLIATLEWLLEQENKVLENWTVKKKKLDQCQQFVLFERSAKQVSVLIISNELHTFTTERK